MFSCSSDLKKKASSLFSIFGIVVECIVMLGTKTSSDPNNIFLSKHYTEGITCISTLSLKILNKVESSHPNIIDVSCCSKNSTHWTCNCWVIGTRESRRESIICRIRWGISFPSDAIVIFPKNEWNIVAVVHKKSIIPHPVRPKSIAVHDSIIACLAILIKNKDIPSLWPFCI